MKKNDSKKENMTVSEALDVLNEDEYIDIKPITDDDIKKALKEVEDGEVISVSSVDDMFKKIGW